MVGESGVARRAVAIPLAVLAFVVAGCGGSTTKTVTERTVTQQPAPATPSVTQQSTPAASPTPGPAPSTGKLPNLVGLRLDEAESKLDDMSVSYKEIGGGVAGIVVRSNWTVCKTDPPAGAKTAGPVKLIVNRSC